MSFCIYCHLCDQFIEDVRLIEADDFRIRHEATCGHLISVVPSFAEALLAAQATLFLEAQP